MPYINFYLDFGAQGRPAFVPVEYMSFRDAVELVRDNGACWWSRILTQPVGPGAYRREAAGARGRRIEVFNNYHDDRQIAHFAPLVRRRGL